MLENAAEAMPASCFLLHKYAFVYCMALAYRVLCLHMIFALVPILKPIILCHAHFARLLKIKM